MRAHAILCGGGSKRGREIGACNHGCADSNDEREFLGSGYLGRLERLKMSPTLMLVTFIDGEASSWLSSGYLKRRFKFLLGIEKEDRQEGGKRQARE